jgi:hypothetical protein
VKRKTVRCLVYSDSHCGQEFGLTHPDFDATPNDTTSPRYRHYRLRRKMWDFFDETIKMLQPIDIVFDLADNIDGKGDASAGTELILPKLAEQIDCATACLQHIGAGAVYMVYGTPYHVGRDNCEDTIAKNVGAVKIGDHDFLRVNNTVFDYSHFVGGGALPTSAFAPLARERLNNMLWNEHDEYPKANIILRGHTHRCVVASEPGNWLAMTCPALQLSSKFGRSRIRSVVHFGLVWFDVADDEFVWPNVVVKRLRSSRQELMVYEPGK